MRDFLTAVCVLLVTVVSQVDAKPEYDLVDGLLLAKPYDRSRQEINIQDYWVSEKLDGIRARWDGTELRTRNNNIIYAPAWFTQHWPNATIDGELWIERGQFELTASIVLSKSIEKRSHSVANSLSKTVSTADAITTKGVVSSERWAKVKFMAFDMPISSQPFSSRLNMLNRLGEATPNPTFVVVPQFKLMSIGALEEKLSQITQEGGEGLMLHHEQSLYISGRSNKLLKVKRFEDAEAKVLAILPGRGRFNDMMGSLVVETREGIQFKLGTGFSERERQSPPALGSWVTYKYYGLTKNGKPRFASYLRTRPQADLSR